MRSFFIFFVCGKEPNVLLRKGTDRNVQRILNSKAKIQKQHQLIKVEQIHSSVEVWILKSKNHENYIDNNYGN